MNAPAVEAEGTDSRVSTAPEARAAPIARLLIIDDELAHMRALCDTLELEGYATSGFGSAAASLQALRHSAFDLLITDLMMPEMDGIALLTAAQQVDADIAGIVMTGHAAIDTAVKAIQAGACDYIVKPFRLNQLLPVISRALEARRLRCLNKELERRIHERTRELEVANRDLEAFSYSVSHDLRAPLRQIQGLCDVFVEDHGAGVSSEGRAVLADITAVAADAGQLIEELLRFARLGREPLTRQLIVMYSLVAEVVHELRAQSADRQIDVCIHDLPDAEGDARLLKQVFLNLLANAFKFTARRSAARIEVGKVMQDGQSAYFVKDNGAGFDMRYAAKLFGVFQRLHSQSEFKGTGVGLSIVQRIVERHGGRVWAEGRPDNGATFYVSLPAK